MYTFNIYKGVKNDFIKESTISSTSNVIIWKNIDIECIIDIWLLISVKFPFEWYAWKTYFDYFTLDMTSFFFTSNWNNPHIFWTIDFQTMFLMWFWISIKLPFQRYMMWRYLDNLRLDPPLRRHHPIYGFPPITKPCANTFFQPWVIP